MNNRLKEILLMIQNEPKDPFLWYVLALEYNKLDNKVKTEESFRRLLGQFPDYLPAYYQAAHFFWNSGSVEKAKITFQKGIELANKNKDDKTVQELQNAYQNFLIELGED